jgi:fluoroquinolone resistance protein
MKQRSLFDNPSDTDNDTVNVIKDESYYADIIFNDVSFEKHKKIKSVEFCECTFQRCKFSEINIFDCTLENCKFENCDLTMASIKYSSFRDVLFTCSKLSGIQWSEAAAPLDVNFKECIMDYCSFMEVDLRNIDLVDCKLREADFIGADLTKANCSYSDFSGTRFSGTNLTRADFTNAINYAIHPSGNKLCKTKFSLPEALSFLDVFDIIIE